MDRVFAQVSERIDLLLQQKDVLFVAIDGNCTAGKTTLTQRLAERYDCNVFHMDDFFLRPEQRTPERYEEAGGNVDYERFLQEVLLPLKEGGVFSYRPFDCSTFSLSAPIGVIPKKLNIIEGTYSQHPYFGHPYDLTVFLSVTEQVQRSRILERPAFLHQSFFEKWIPMEAKYFEAFRIRENADVIL